MNYDLDYRYRRALHPDGLRTIAPANQAVTDAMADCRRAGQPGETDPAVLLLARHLGRIASGFDPELMHEADLDLRSRCMNRIAELKTKPALVAIVRGRDTFNAEEKSLFHAEAKKALRSLAAAAGLTPSEYDLRSNIAGPAVRDRVSDQILREALLTVSSEWAFPVSKDNAAGYARDRAHKHLSLIHISEPTSTY